MGNKSSKTKITTNKTKSSSSSADKSFIITSTTSNQTRNKNVSSTPSNQISKIINNLNKHYTKMIQIFKKNGTNCNGKSSSSIINKCDYVQRLILSLKFYQISINKHSKHSLNLFLSEIYGAHSFIDDMKHYKQCHCNDNEEILKIKNAMINFWLRL